MDMFEGKKGFRIFKRRKDAEFVLKRNEQVEENSLKIQKVKISDSELAKEMGISIHPDLSITTESPEKGETGWIVIKKNENIGEKYGKAIELVEK